MLFFELIKAIILGIVEGMTEFAPVSSTGHMILVDDMWLKSTDFLGPESAFTFKIVIQLGSIFAAAWIFRHKYFEMLHIGKYAPAQQPGRRSKLRRLNLLHIIIGMIPAGVLGLLFDDLIEKYLFSVPTVLIGLFLGAIYMIIADKFSLNVKNPKTLNEITYFQAFVIGLSQAVAMWPGFSRSGSTISTGVLMKLDHKSASDFTFIMAVPVMLAASGLSIIKHLDYIELTHIPFYILGFLAAFTFGFISIKLFLKLIQNVKLLPFAIYRIVLVVVIAVVYFGIIK
ncbi:undecaprenyl-diphosphate phosphatase [Staphylococcus pseudintermedius]|uniref:undecaprenyl-diphosphate phosphatase n=1 Tax=Staphylococcus pseudintermedius TaxID=283734 RepID=UPI0001FFACD6|nr:undecaprenyl-diphosphate phosphatase [Staphylococcus pseudintermedius]ADX77300.1 undecaprenyl-diphosphatase UppP [Staphylococcus pseudintermedius ED99]ANQ82568.1 undecaprenyl-diphosphatase [Staphylococcus pseudintermedius]EGQ0325844.1 undecaprenyl-diphosphate phosphatase [Staphylococcus pseudintermedius]EGQ0362008.1 undecaprenyl-diphosphate phosphatase [Staphylococcus pseudintermedius]EGQ1294063.1 undecaprenyl-diphosphate phosphatase [Staphylococcus pseudintermedius]